MKKKSIRNFMTRYKYFYKDKNYYRRLLNRIIIVIIILLIMFLLKSISLNFTKNIIRIVKNGINYEFDIKEDGRRIIEGVKKLKVFPQRIKTVFNITEEKEEFIPPVEGNIYKPYGQVYTGENKIFNKGVDIIPTGDNTIYSIGNGVVLEIEDKKNLGYYITIKYDELQVVYGHLVEFYVSQGDTITKGQKVGSLKNISNDGNRYLHFEIWKDGNPINPEEIINLK